MLQSVLSKTVEQSVAEQPLCPNCGRGMWLYCVQWTDAPPVTSSAYSVAPSARNRKLSWSNKNSALLRSRLSL